MSSKKHVGNEEQYNKAKDESEPIFYEGVVADALKQYKSPRFSEPHRATEQEDKCMHVDVFVYDSIDEVDAHVDVKHVEPKNANSGNYTVNKDVIEYGKKRKNHWLAFRLTNGKALLNEFLCVKTQYVYRHCLSKERKNKDGTSYYLVNIEEVKAKCKELCTVKLDY